MRNKLKVLLACEESQSVTKEFRKLGHEAYSCDILPCSGGHPEWHLQQDVTDLLKQKWDLVIAFPPCTFIAGSGVQWLSHPDDRALPFEKRRPHPKYPNRRNDMEKGVEFFMMFANADCERVAIENPIGLMSSRYRKPNQIIQPYMFGDEATKSTCLWLKALPALMPTNIVSKGDRVRFKSGKSHPKWYADALRNTKSKEERQRIRSKTFPGIAKAMATQWSEYILKQL